MDCSKECESLELCGQIGPVRSIAGQRASLQPLLALLLSPGAARTLPARSCCQACQPQTRSACCCRWVGGGAGGGGGAEMPRWVSLVRQAGPAATEGPLAALLMQLQARITIHVDHLNRAAHSPPLLT